MSNTQEEEHYPTYRAMLVEERLSDYEIEVEGVSSVIDVLTDLRHLCDRYLYDFAALDRMARYRYQAEIGEDGIAHPK